MAKKPTKEELAVEIAKLRDSHAGWVSADERRRKEFAKAFTWYVPNNHSWNQERQPLIPTWEQIFVNVGQLLAQRDFRNYEGNISEMELAIGKLQKEIYGDKENPHA